MSEQLQTTQFGRYRLERLISRGGMGEIFLARTEGPGGFKKQVCIKKILPHLSREPEFVARFIDEANIVVSLTHGNIVPVIDMGEVDGDYYIAMEYIAGRDLRDLLKRYEVLGERMPAPIAVFVVSEICKGLAYAHKKTDEAGHPLDIVHRDVSPSNILISREGVIKLTDFGIAKAVSKLGKSITGRLQGKFCYMSPEQAAGKSVDRKSDLFSVGTVAYELLSGVRPFEGSSDLDTLERVRNVRAKQLCDLVDDLPPAIYGAVSRALEPNLDERYGDANELAAELIDAIDSTERASEPEMAAELTRLFPGKEVMTEMAGTGMRLDDVLAMEADRMLMASPLGESPTLTVQSPVGPIFQAGRVGPLPTPSPAQQFTPSPMFPTHPSMANAEVPRRSPWRGLAFLVICAAAAAIGLPLVSSLSEPAYIDVDCDPDGAIVFVNNENRGLCDVKLEVEPGAVEVLVTSLGFQPVAGQRGEAVRGETLSFVFALIETESSSFDVTVVVEPSEAFFSIDGTSWHESGALVTLDEPGHLQVRLRANGYHDLEELHDFQPGAGTIALSMSPIVVEGEPDATAEPEIRESGSRAGAARDHVVVTPSVLMAVITVDGQPQGDAGRNRVRFDSNDGVMEISAILNGYTAEVFRFNPDAPNPPARITIELQPISELQPVWIWVSDPALATVYVDGLESGSAPGIVEMTPGAHHVRVWNAELRLEEDRIITVRIASEPQSEPQSEPFFQPR